MISHGNTLTNPQIYLLCDNSSALENQDKDVINSLWKEIKNTKNKYLILE